MAKVDKKPPVKKSVETFVHDEAKRKNIPTAEMESVARKSDASPVPVTYERNRDLDPQLVWRGKDEQDWSDLVVSAPALYIQEKIHPKVLIDDLKKETEKNEHHTTQQLDLFSDFNGIPEGADKTDFYRHDQNWSNRMILGDSLHVMASLAEREGLRGKVQCIYLDPPYGIKFNSNFQWSTTSRDVKDGDVKQITREPEQVKAFRDTWRDGIHSYLTYLRDRLTVARDLLTDSGSIFVQIGDENVHRVRALMDEVFGDENFVSLISVAKTMGATSRLIPNTTDYIVWFSKNMQFCKYRKSFIAKKLGEDGTEKYSHVESLDNSVRHLSEEEKNGLSPLTSEQKPFLYEDITSQTGGDSIRFPIFFRGQEFNPSKSRGWRTNEKGMQLVRKADRLLSHDRVLMFKRFLNDFPAGYLTNSWTDTSSGSSTSDPKIYVVQTRTTIIQRCILMTTDPGDLVLDPTCGSGTTAYVAEQWGRRWITIDTSRVALALARARIMGARYPYYILKDSPEGQLKEAEIVNTAPSTQPTYGSVRQGFVYERVPHITLKSIANNAEIDVIWEKWQEKLEPLRDQLNKALGRDWQEWEIPQEATESWPTEVKKIHADWWKARIARQKEIDASISAHAEFEYLFDKPYAENKKVRVAGPFTVESMSPHRMIEVNEDGEPVDPHEKTHDPKAEAQSFVNIILENLKTSGVQQAHKDDKIDFISLKPWPGENICAEGRYMEGVAERRAGVFIGPEFSTVRRADLVAATREAADAGFDVLVSCAFSYEAHSTDFDKLGYIPVLKARMNADLHMSDDLKNTGKGNLFVIFGEPDIDILDTSGGMIVVKINGVDVFDPSTGEVKSDGPDGIACWFVDTDYNEESFFVRQAYFLGANDPYKSLKTTLKAEINEEAWATLRSAASRPFEKPAGGKIAVKVINHLGDEVMKVYRV
ncbi:restriction endonuclease subunit M [Synergistales bacterium]|nr:restriction endonuclease subunit M [Synergistales bacterium]